MKVFGDKKFTSDFLKYASEAGIDLDKYFYAIQTDLADDCSFSVGYVLLGREWITCAFAKQLSDEIRYFKGAGFKQDLNPAISRVWTSDTYRVEDLREIKIEKLVSGASIVAEAENDSYRLAIVSNHCMGGAMKLEKVFKELKEKGEVSEDTLKDSNEEEFCPKCGMMYPDQNRKVCPNCINKRSLFGRTLKYLKPHKGKLFIKFLCYFITAALNLVWPYLNGTILYDKVLTKDDKFVGWLGLKPGDYILALGLVVITMILTKITIQAVGILQGVINVHISPAVARDMKNDIFKSMGKLSVNFYSSKETGSLMTRVLNDADEVFNLFTDGLPYFIINVLTMTATIVIMFTLSVSMTLFTLVMVPIIFLVSWRMLPNLWHRYGHRHRVNRSLNSKIHDNINGSRVVKAFGQEEEEINRFEKANGRVQDAEMAVVVYDSKLFQLYHGVENVMELFLWVIGAYLITSGTSITLGVLITLTSYARQLSGPMDFFAHFLRQFVNAMNASERMYEIMDAVPQIVEKEGAYTLPKLRGDVELKNVTFGYEEHKDVLKNVSFKVKAGEMLGIVGRSGAGKTTIVNLINRLYDPREGEVLIDGYNVKDLSFQTLRGNIAMVSQESYIFMGTVAENIRYAKKDATDAEVVRAAVLASAHDFICKMPDGYDTRIGSGGRMLSGGEKQRISIARAILCNPKILILDEATASVDTETELAIQASINMLIKGRTTISIAHRLSTLRDATHLVVIDDGKVAEEGSHAELLEQKGIYFKLRELQTKVLAIRD